MNRLSLRLPWIFSLHQARPYSSLRDDRSNAIPLLVSSFHSVGRLGARKRDNFSFSSKAPLLHPQEGNKGGEKVENAKRKTRSSAAKNSLRRVAVEAQRSRDGKQPQKAPAAPFQSTSKTVTAMCAAEEYDIAKVASILEGLGHILDPLHTELHDQVVHVSVPVHTNSTAREETTWTSGDLFVFPSGTVVAWAIPDNVLSGMVSQTLLPAAKDPLAKYEEEDLEYIEDPTRENSSIKGDRIVLGTKTQPLMSTEEEKPKASLAIDHESGQTQSRSLDTVLAKIAFSSGLARSTKLAVLESLLANYFESTKSIPAELSRGGRMPFSRRFISQKTGQLLSIRAQLNLYSELTDSLPDLFWDSRHELGLEGYYDQVGKALDTNIRIKVLNEKMDYAQEIASVLRQHLSEVHGVRLEWIIIVLIAVEVVFAIRNEIKDYIEHKATDREAFLDAQGQGDSRMVGDFIRRLRDKIIRCRGADDNFPYDHSMQRQTLLAIPINKDVCVFCATRLQFASSRPTRSLSRRFFRSTAARHRPPSAAAAQKGDGADQGAGTAWRSDPLPKQTGGGWAPAAAPRDLTPEEQALRNVLQTSPKPSSRQGSNTRDHDRLHREQGEGSSFQSGPGMAQSYRSQQRGGGRAANSGGTEFRSGLREPYRNEAKSPKRTGYNETRPESQRSSGLIFRKTAAKNSDSAFGQAFQQAQQKWACPDCGFRNYDNHTMCRRCRVGKRPSNEHSASTSERTSNISHHGVETKGGREGQWACPKCGCSNSLTSRSCSECSLSQSKATPIEKGDDDEILRADGWKHLRRRAPLADGQPTQQPLSARSRNSTDANTSTSATTAEQERMARLERTRDGRFVGLQQGRHGPETSSDRPTNGGTSHLDTSELAEAEEKTSAASKRNDNWARWEPSSPSEFQSIDPSRLRTQPRAERSLETLEGWDFSVEGTAGSGVPTEHNVPSQAVTADEGQKRTSTIRSSLSFDPNFEDDDQPRRPHRAENSDRYRPREDRPGPRGSGIRGPSGQNRFKQRRNSQFIASIDEFEEDDEMRAERWAERKQQREKAKIAQKAAAPPTPIHLPEFISVSNLAAVLRVRVENFTQKMEELGFEATSTDHVLDAETAGLIAAEFNFEPIIERAGDLDLLPLPPAEDKSILPPRPPVVTIMGHVDHGKTTLLDYLRKSSVAASEHGGITQHIGAFSVSMPGGRLVTFLDTPGHEAFLSMRQRGANVTDIVILVVAADDSVKPQTVEAIKHAQAAKVPMIVAVNKIDKEDSDVERVKQDLARYGVEIEDYGGDTQVVCVSGKTGQGMDKLEDAAVALADILDMRSEIDGQAEGWVLEATTKKAGRVATVLVRRGTLWPGDIIVAGNSWARVRSLRNEAGAMVPLAGPGTPVEIDGWREQPSAGDEVIQAPDEQKAKSVIEYRLEASERTKLAADMEAVNEARRIEQQKREQLEKAAELAAANPDAPAPADSPDASPAPPTFQEVFFIVKADVSGSVEAVTNSVSALGNSEVRPHILRSGVGPITEFDIDHAAVAKGHIINFNTAVEGQIRRTAESKEVDIIDQSIIYRLVDAVKAKLGERLPPIVTQSVIGEAEISRVFEINPKGRVKVPVAGCKVRNGVITKTSKVRVLRHKEVIFTGSLSSLKNVKKDVTEMRKGNECGLSFEDWTEFEVGDQVQTYEEIVEKRSL